MTDEEITEIIRGHGGIFAFAKWALATKADLTAKLARIDEGYLKALAREVEQTMRAEAAEAKAAVLLEALKECADKLEVHVKADYASTRDIYPSEQRRYERAMKPVTKARALLSALNPVPQEERHE